MSNSAYFLDVWILNKRNKICTAKIPAWGFSVWYQLQQVPVSGKNAIINANYNFSSYQDWFYTSQLELSCR